jgi:hypothetical protein
VSVTAQFRQLAGRVVDDLLRADPVSATSLGDHRFDDRLPDLSARGTAGQLRSIDEHLAELDAVDDAVLQVDDLVDLEILRASLLRSQFELGELRPQTWDPLQWNPGTALYLLLSREFDSADVRRESLVGRLAAIPDFLGDARSQLGVMSAVHVETAMAQLAGTAVLIDSDARALARDDRATDRARDAVLSLGDWLGERLASADRSPRLGERLYSAALWHGLDDGTTSAELLHAAEGHLDLVDTALREAAAEYLGLATADRNDVRVALDEVARRSPVTDESVLAIVAEALERTTRFAREHDLVDVLDLDVRIVEMPEIHRGVSVAYCDAPGPLEQAHLPAYVAVAPTPSGWDAGRVASFYREYNSVQLHGLTIHEAMPGHVLQLAHAQHLSSPTAVRRFGRSGAFVEGWAVYAEALMVASGYGASDDPRERSAMRLQQLKMQARGAINAILDIRVHTDELQEREGMALMRERGFQEEGEAVGKWRRALLTAGQLSTYFAGYRSVEGIANDLRVLHPEWTHREIHDLMLSHGSPAPRHLRTLLGI